MLDPTQVQQVRQQFGITPSTPAPANNFADKLSSAIKGNAPQSTGTNYMQGNENDWSDMYSKDYPNILNSAEQHLGQMVKPMGPGQSPSNVASGALGVTSDAVNALGEGVVKPVVSTVTNIPAVQKFAMGAGSGLADIGQKIQDLAKTHPNIANLINVAMGLAGAKGMQGVDLGDTAETAMNATGNDLNTLADKASNALPNDPSAEESAGPSQLQNIKTALSKGNVDPRLATSASRLDDPMGVYNKFAERALQTKGDVKGLSPVSDVGDEGGDALKQVVNMRKTVGQMMANEIDGSMGDTPTNIGDAQNTFKSELADNGLQYSPKTETLKVIGSTKMSSADQSMLEDFSKSLDDLGPNPSVKQLDDFIGKTEAETQLYKGRNNITGTTNAERIMSNTLNSMREQFSPEATGNPDLQDYYDFRQSYAKLSDLIDEGIKYFGKINARGDFMRDTSVTKNAISSILGDGKNEFLQNLEELTGKPILDHAVLADQAMQDVGDLRAGSVFRAIMDNPPTSQSGIIKQLMDWGLGKAKNALVGSPADQTRTFLQSLQDQGKNALSTPNMISTANTTSPSTGDTANNMTQSNNSIMDNSLSQDDTNVNSLGDKIKNIITPTSKGSDLESNLKTSGGDWDKAIQTGDIPKEQIYKPNGEFTPQAADHVVSDLVGKMNESTPGLGDEFKKTLDMSNPTRTSLVQQAVDFVQKDSQGGYVKNPMYIFKDDDTLKNSTPQEKIDAILNVLQYKNVGGSIVPSDMPKATGPANANPVTSSVTNPNIPAKEDFRGIPMNNKKNPMDPHNQMAQLVTAYGPTPEAIAGDAKINALTAFSTPAQAAALHALVAAEMTGVPEAALAALIHYYTVSGTPESIPVAVAQWNVLFPTAASLGVPAGLENNVSMTTAAEDKAVSAAVTASGDKALESSFKTQEDMHNQAKAYLSANHYSAGNSGAEDARYVGVLEDYKKVLNAPQDKATAAAFQNSIQNKATEIKNLISVSAQAFNVAKARADTITDPVKRDAAIIQAVNAYNTNIAGFSEKFNPSDFIQDGPTTTLQNKINNIVTR